MKRLISLSRLLTVVFVLSVAGQAFTQTTNTTTSTTSKTVVTKDQNNGNTKTCPKSGTSCSGTKVCNNSSKCGMSCTEKSKSCTGSGKCTHSGSCSGGSSSCNMPKAGVTDTTKNISAVEATKEKSNLTLPGK